MRVPADLVARTDRLRTSGTAAEARLAQLPFVKQVEMRQVVQEATFEELERRTKAAQQTFSDLTRDGWEAEQLAKSAEYHARMQRSRQSGTLPALASKTAADPDGFRHSGLK